MKINRIVLLTIAGLLTACTNEANIEQEIEAEVENLESVAEETSSENTIELPRESQTFSDFPWEDNEDFQKELSKNETEVLIAGYSTVFEEMTSEEAENIRLAAEAISGKLVQPGEVFSQNEIAGPYTEERGYLEGTGYVNGQAVKDFGGGVCRVATTLYNTAIASDLEIIERHNHSMPVPYVPYGQDAAVAYGYKDFQFKNTSENPLLIWTELIDQRLFMGFYGKEEAPDIQWAHEVLSETETSTEYIKNSELAETEEHILVKGMDGKVVESILKIKEANGEEKIIELGRSSYAPLKHVIEISE